jgi:CheY-like chemotaxis protein
MGDHLTTTNYYNVLKEVSNVISSSSSAYYDQLITKLQLQVLREYEYDMLKQQQCHQRPQEEKEIHLQKKKKRILLVDDERDHCMVYQIILQDAGYECISYTDSVKALQEFRPNYYNLVILDIKMPKLDGFALCEKIREVDRALQIIFITASEAYYENFRKQYYPRLSNDINVNCLQKPIGNQELVQIVNTTIATKDAN